MLSRFIPQEVRYFDFFNAYADQLVCGSQALVALLSIHDDAEDDVTRRCDRIDDIKACADRIKRETMRQLHTSFMTPLDREDIHQLITCLDQILDRIQDVAYTLILYRINHMPPEVNKLGEICHACCGHVRSAVALLSSMDNGPRILKICGAISQLESQADSEMRLGMSRLFREESDIRRLIKYKTVYELLEIVTDRCEDVANIIEGLVVDNS